MSSIQDLTKEVGLLVHAGLREKLLPALFAAGLGLVLLYAAGFSEISVLHNATHDGRHSAAFPCH